MRHCVTVYLLATQTSSYFAVENLQHWMVSLMLSLLSVVLWWYWACTGDRHFLSYFTDAGIIRSRTWPSTTRKSCRCCWPRTMRTKNRCWSRFPWLLSRTRCLPPYPRVRLSQMLTCKSPWSSSRTRCLPPYPRARLSRMLTCKSVWALLDPPSSRLFCHGS